MGTAEFLGCHRGVRVSDHIWVLGMAGFGWIPSIGVPAFTSTYILELRVGHSPIPPGAAGLDDSEVLDQLQVDI